MQVCLASELSQFLSSLLNFNFNFRFNKTNLQPHSWQRTTGDQILQDRSLSGIRTSSTALALLLHITCKPSRTIWRSVLRSLISMGHKSPEEKLQLFRQLVAGATTNLYGVERLECLVFICAIINGRASSYRSALSLKRASGCKKRLLLSDIKWTCQRPTLCFEEWSTRTGTSLPC